MSLKVDMIPDNQVALGLIRGKGGFGKVYEGKWKGRNVAVKILKIFENDTASKKALSREVAIASNLAHKNIPVFYGLLSSGKGFVMELMEESLYSAINNQKIALLSDVQRVSIIKEAASGLVYLHNEKILHRDIKSMNILLSKNSVKLADFGIAKLRESSTKTNTVIVGTYGWMAPEVMKGEGDYGEPADIYSLSLVMWEIFHEKIPFADLDNPVQFAMQIGINGRREIVDLSKTPQQMNLLIKKCWNAPHLRPTATDFLDAIDNYLYAQSKAPSAEPQTAPSTFEPVGKLNYLPKRTNHPPIKGPSAEPQTAPSTFEPVGKLSYLPKRTKHSPIKGQPMLLTVPRVIRFSRKPQKIQASSNPNEKLEEEKKIMQIFGSSQSEAHKFLRGNPWEIKICKDGNACKWYLQYNSWGNLWLCTDNFREHLNQMPHDHPLKNIL